MYEDAIGEAWPWTDGPLLLLHKRGYI
eukprot:COSAG01_NODE_23962_length_795_cov_1.547414_1_plen_26_part_10